MRGVLGCDDEKLRPTPHEREELFVFKDVE
jgi:hypothetical protein